MRFEDFARLHGLRLGSLIHGKWVAVPTEDHPRKRNGRYKFLGDVGWVQNWATMTSPEMWRSGEERTPEVRRIIQNLDRERNAAAEHAASKAAWILHQSKTGPHAYLASKGFKEEQGNVWNDLLVVPMRRGSRLVGAQLISDKGDKKFLQGQRTKGAAFVIDAKGLPIFVEGYATGLSVRTIMKSMKVRYTIYVCFSAGNMKEISREIPGGFVVADNDPNRTGEVAALECGKPYWLSETVGEDFNDFHLRVGLFSATAALKPLVFASASGTSLRSA
jgi:putative DNA primase/helicase